MVMDVSAFKIGLLGPPNAGKSSLLRVLKGEYERLLSITPTKLVDREMIGLMDKVFVVWDFGGQDHYRQRYISEPTYFLDEIQYLIYVIDILDDEKIELARKYFYEIMQKMKELKYHFKLAILFNKIDPYAENNPELHKKANLLTEEFEMHASKFDLTPKFFRTSIFDPISVVDAFSHFFIDTGLKNYLHEILKEFGKKFNLIYAGLFSSSNVVISSFSSPFKDPNSLNSLVSGLLKSENFKELLSDPIKMEQKEENVLVLPIKFQKQLFKLMTIFPPTICLDSEELKNGIEDVQKQIAELLEKMHLSSKMRF
jgi:GTPase SAR1 family protein